MIRQPKRISILLLFISFCAASIPLHAAFFGRAWSLGFGLMCSYTAFHTYNRAKTIWLNDIGELAQLRPQTSGDSLPERALTAGVAVADLLYGKPKTTTTQMADTIKSVQTTVTTALGKFKENAKKTWSNFCGFFSKKPANQTNAQPIEKEPTQEVPVKTTVTAPAPEKQKNNFVEKTKLCVNTFCFFIPRLFKNKFDIPKTLGEQKDLGFQVATLTGYTFFLTALGIWKCARAVL